MTDDTARIELRRKGQPSLWALIDAEDAPRVRERSWHVLIRPHTMYAQTSVQQNYRRFSILLHRYIIGAPGDREVDHINGNGLDNQKSNLRLATTLQNAHNGRARGGRSHYKGVSLEYGKWRAAIRHDGKKIRIGLYVCEADAARAYDRCAFLMRGEFARLNFPEEYGLDPAKHAA